MKRSWDGTVKAKMNNFYVSFEIVQLLLSVTFHKDIVDIIGEYYNLVEYLLVTHQPPLRMGSGGHRCVQHYWIPRQWVLPSDWNLVFSWMTRNDLLLLSHETKNIRDAWERLSREFQNVNPTFPSINVGLITLFN